MLLSSGVTSGCGRGSPSVERVWLVAGFGFVRDWPAVRKILGSIPWKRPVVQSESDPMQPYLEERWRLFRTSLEGVSRYLEFGSGLSTEFAAQETHAQIVSVETDACWADRIENKLGGRVTVLHVDLGPVGDWGRPLDYSRRGDFPKYLETGFEKMQSPELVLIDGRFRVAAFLTTLLRSEPGTIIVFDDYPPRPAYHIVEDFVDPVETSDFQAMFVRPESIDERKVLDLRSQFVLVMD